MTRIVATTVVALFVCAFAVPAFAQDQPQQGPSRGRQQADRPFRGLFGGSPDPTHRQTLDLTFSTNGDYIDNVSPFRPLPGEAAGAGDPRFSDSYFFSSTNLSLAYARRWSHVSLAASSSHNGFYYPDFHELTGVGHAGRVALNATSGQRFSVNASQSFSYSPFYGMGSMFGLDPTANPFIWNPLFGVAQRDNFQFFTNAGTSYDLTRRTALSAAYVRRQVRFTQDDSSLLHQHASVRLAHRFTRNASVYAGYGRGWGDYSTVHVGGSPVTQHDIDAGVDYSRSLTRRSTIGFSTGAVVYKTTLRTHYRFLGNAHFDAQIGRSWAARAEYRRGLNWVEGFSQPVFSDRVTLGAGGYLGRRLELSFAAGYSNGQPALSGGSAGVDTYTGRSHVRLALNRFVGLSAQYLYYHYTFSADYPRPPSIPSTLDRQTVLFGVDLWLPLLR